MPQNYSLTFSSSSLLLAGTKKKLRVNKQKAFSNVCLYTTFPKLIQVRIFGVQSAIHTLVKQNMASAIKASVTSALDPDYSASQITFEKIDLAPLGEMQEHKTAFLLRHVFTPAECQELIKLSEDQSYQPAMINVADGEAVRLPGYRDGHRVMIDDPEFVKILFNRISKYLPEDFYGNTLLEINERLRFLRYGPTDKFMPHTDGAYTRKDASTFVTLQMYLNEGFDGGETTFLERRPANETPNRIPVVPETGMILVFQHDIYHEGSVVNSGTKYTIRGDVLYAYPRPGQEAKPKTFLEGVKGFFTKS